MPRVRLIIAVLGALFTLFLVPIATNIATSSVPGWLQPYTWLAWPALVVLAPVTIALVIVGDKSDRLSNNIIESTRANRHRMVAEVRRIWIDGYLKRSWTMLSASSWGWKKSRIPLAGRGIRSFSSQTESLGRCLPAALWPTPSTNWARHCLFSGLRGRARRHCFWSWRAICSIEQSRT